MTSRVLQREARTVLVPFVLARAVVLGALVTAHLIFDNVNLGPHRQTDGLLAWDAAWYRDIATSGYDFINHPEGLRFLPLFPLLGHIVSRVPGINPSVAVVLVANVCALLLGFVVYRLVLEERGDEVLARRALWILYLAPPSYVLVMGYAEATFLLFSAIALLTLRTERWWIAAIANFFAALTRPQGVLLAIPSAIEGIRRRDWRAIAPSVAPFVGLLSYLAWAARRTHDFMLPMTLQNDPERRGNFVDPFSAIGHNVREVLNGGRISSGFHVVTAILFIGLLYVLAKRWPLSFTLYAAAVLIIALGSRNLDSLERYGLAAVPFVLAAADIVNTNEHERSVLALIAAGLLGAAVLAFTGPLVP